MVHIRGRVGDWPIDLNIELGEAEWAQLERLLAASPGRVPPGEAGASNKAETVPGSPPVAAGAPGAEVQWRLACELLREAGEMDGPQLLARLGALAGNMQAGKRLLVRLRHSPGIEVASRDGTVLYRWIGDQ